MQVSNPGRVAFIFFPHRPETIPLDTMPFAAHVIKQLAAAHCQIDVFCFNSSTSSYPDDLWAPPGKWAHTTPCADVRTMKTWVYILSYIAPQGPNAKGGRDVFVKSM